MSKDKEDTGNVVDMAEESHVKQVKKDAYYVASPMVPAWS